ncbi:uncharacterized protein Z520_08381 [Fonsecaea multimorphosa CBS 102226]|uniref:J domain-containing protein n=1 Tax=Fonsecaea multimorphosa CBS 102226 TaxID=1442371 RepID=A0A0D2IGE3_9EURO|nr:uncharacterized protein Z520_08381 [Fonsecaea multimorphosa CBS 102226]KIX96126.1 hypothetical protein Z520_08381 [Fonsecaea multimorphosa CBS 102226]OAL19142.1 hypothetical protein AYO22_10090 [Fonsecaea multimorphosa]
MMRRIFFLLFLVAVCVAWSAEDYELFKLHDELETHEGPGVTFYDVLGVSPHATVDQISAALKKKSRTLHPDKVKHSFIASRSTASPKKGKKKPGVHISKGPSQREISRVVKDAQERYSRLTLIGTILRGPGRERYDFFEGHGWPSWRGTGYYYQRYRPGLGTVLLGLFLIGGGAVHYFVLTMNYKRHRDFMERYIRYAKKQAWGDESGIRGIPGLGDPVDVAPAVEEAEPMANLNRRQRREMERQNKKEKTSKPAPAPAPKVVPSSTPDRRRVTAENGKVLVVDSEGNVYLEEEDEDGNTQEYLLDLDEIPKPTVWDTAVLRLPVWLYRKAARPLMKNAQPVPEDKRTAPESEAREAPLEPTEKVIDSDNTTPLDMSSSQISDSGFEIVDTTGLENSNGTNVKKRGKKARK